MTPKQAILAALNGEITRPQLMEYCGIIRKGDKYIYKRKPTVLKEFIPPTYQEVEDYFILKGYNKIGARKAYEYYTIGDWKDSKGNQVKNWKQKMFSNWLKDEYLAKPTHSMYKKLDI